MALTNPVVIQPQSLGAANWMPIPQVPNCPRGLEYLTLLDQIICHQMVEMLQVITGFETNNKYIIKNNLGQQIFYVVEETDLLMRMCCGNLREFTLKVLDNYQREVMRIHRPFKCCGGCCWCADSLGHIVTVESPPGIVIGRVRQTTSACAFNFLIESATGEAQLQIKGPCCPCKCCADVEFPVLSLDGTQNVGMITKQWSGLVQEMFTNADNFGVTFPINLDVKTKATLIGAMFLIDFMAFEQQNKNN